MAEYRLVGSLHNSFIDILGDFDHHHVNFRLWAKDASLFTGHDEASMLDWLTEPLRLEKDLPSLLHIKNSLDAHHFSSVVLLGMGGSSLSSTVFHAMFSPKQPFFVMDTIHPQAIIRLKNRLQLQSTLFIVASKSGSTLEPLLLYRYFLNMLIEAKAKDPFSHFMAITDPVTPLEQEAAESGFLHGPFGQPGIGGRFAALSVFGIMPALLMGVDVKRLLQSAIAMMDDSGPSISAHDNPSARLAAFLAASLQAGNNQVFMHLSPTLTALGLWLEQLIAESLGKNNTGLIPIIAHHHCANFTAGTHVFIGIEKEMGPLKTLADSMPNDTPLFFISIDDKYELGGLMFRFEMAVSLLASMLNINPFDQPDVEKSKRYTKDILAKMEEGQDNLLGKPHQNLANVAIYGDVANFFSTITSIDYCAVLSYLDETAQHLSRLDELKTLMEKKFGIGVILQSGPRYLHSTGQLFKGGHNSGHFLIITGPYSEDAPSGQGKLMFSDIHFGQALGDIAAMKQNGRRVLHLHLHDLTAGWTDLIKLINME